MLVKLQNHLINNYSFLKDKKLLIAVSGGKDSITLAHLFHQLNYQIYIAHCNFKLRKDDSKADEIFVKDFASKHNIPFYSIQFDTKKEAENRKISIQMAARELRYEWFYKLMNKHQYDFLLTAHHLDDMLETFIINLTRGTGLDGLVGIPQINDKIIRPLLIFQREEINKYVLENKIEWREDETNVSVKYQRNKIRHQVIPILKEINPSLLSSFQNTINHLKNSQEILIHHINDVKDQIIVTEIKENNEQIILRISIEKLNRLSHPKNYLFELLKNYGFTEWDDIANLANAQSGKFVLGKNFRLVKDRDFLILTDKPAEIDFPIFQIPENTKQLLTPLKLKFQLINPSNIDLKKILENSILVDKDLLKFPLTLRKWEKGDYFYPFGMEGKKKLSKFFKDEKYSLPQKENTWLLCTEHQIVWIIGKRPDNRFKVSPQSNHVLKITLDNEKNT